MTLTSDEDKASCSVDDFSPQCWPLGRLIYWLGPSSRSQRHGLKIAPRRWTAWDKNHPSGWPILKNADDPRPTWVDARSLESKLRTNLTSAEKGLIPGVTLPSRLKLAFARVLKRGAPGQNRIRHSILRQVELGQPSDPTVMPVWTEVGKRFP